MNDQNQQGKISVWHNFGINAAALIFAAFLGFVGNNLWTTNIREANFEIIASQISALDISMKAGFDAVDNRFDATDKRFDAVDKRIDTLENNTSDRYNDFTESIKLLLKQSDDNAKERYSDFAKNINMRFVELIKRVDTIEESLTALEKSVSPSYIFVAEELNEIISLLIKLNDPKLNPEKFNEILAQVESDFEILSKKVESFILSD